MTRTYLAPALAALLLVIPLPAAEKAPVTRDPVVATVGEHDLHLSELIFRLAQLPEVQRRAYLDTPEGLRRFLEDTVARIALAAEAERRGLAEGDLARRLFELRREEVLLDLLARHTLAAEATQAVLQARYRESADRFRVPAVAHVLQILVTPVKDPVIRNRHGDDAADPRSARAKILRLAGRLAAGQPFREVARDWSEGIEAERGGDLGWVSPGELVPPLDRAVFSELKPGTPSRVIETSQGFHLLLVEARRDGGPLPFETVRELLLQEWIGEHRARLLQEAERRRNEALERADVVLHPELLP